jgi:hypothetical protein
MVETSLHTSAKTVAERADDPPGGAPLLTIIVPVYNEAATLFEQLARILTAPYSKQVIVVDDGSTDGTADKLRDWQDDARFKFLRHVTNRGAGTAIRTALPHARGRFTIIQDGDLEYDPEDYPRLIGPLLAGQTRAVFGSRYLSDSRREPIWRKVARAVRAAKSRICSTTKPLTPSVKRALTWIRRAPATQRESHSGETAGSEVRPMQAAGSPVPPAKRRSQRWDSHRLGAAVLKLAARLLYRSRLSDIAATPKAFSVELLRSLDLQCERFEFGAEVAAKLCRAGEKIVEVPIHFERRTARNSWLMGRFGAPAVAAADRRPGRGPVGKKHRWSDGPRTLDTLWRWRHWTPDAPDPGRIPAVAPAIDAAEGKATAGETVPAALQSAIDRWAEEDASQSAFDQAVWTASQRESSAAASAGSPRELESAASSCGDRPEAFSGAGKSPAANAAFEPRLVWELFVRKPSPRVIEDPDERDESEDWAHWGLTDLLLLLVIVNVAVVLLVTMVAPFQSSSGLVLAALASAITFRTTRAGRFNLDKCNQAFALLAVLSVCAMFPSSWAWRDRTMIVIAGIALLASLARLCSKGVRQLDRNLLDAVGILAFFFAGLGVASPDRRVVELLVLLAGITMFIRVHRKRKMRRASDNAFLVAAAIGVFLVVAFSYLFPIDWFRLSWRDLWLQFRYGVLPHWTDFWWLRWGITAALAAMIATLLMNRARRNEA